MNFNGRHLSRQRGPNQGPMPDGELLGVLRRSPQEMAGAAGLARLCEACVGVMAMSGASAVVMTDDSTLGSWGTTDGVSALLGELQYTLGEGPGVDAHHRGHPIEEPDLADPQVARWMAFGPPAVAAGARAVFGFPLIVGAVHLGVLNLYRDRPGPLSTGEHADGVMIAGVAARAVIGMQAGAPRGVLGAELAIGANFPFIVHQASGMVSVQLGVSVSDALACLRAHAFSHDQLATDVAREVVERRLRFTD